jgi:hypothetical protein
MHRITRTALVILVLAAGHAGSRPPTPPRSASVVILRCVGACRLSASGAARAEGQHEISNCSAACAPKTQMLRDDLAVLYGRLRAQDER